VLLINLGSKVNQRNLGCQHLVISSSILWSTIFKVSNHIEADLQDFEVDHKKFIMLLHSSEQSTKVELQMLVILAMVVRF